MSDRPKITIQSLVPPVMWSVSGVVVIAIMVMVTGAPVPQWLVDLAGWYVSFVGPSALIVGMYYTWKLPDHRKWIVIPVELFVLFCGVGLFHFQVDRAKATEQDSAYRAFLASAEYRTALDAYETAKTKWEALAARIEKIPGDFTTGAKLTTAASDEAEASFKAASAALILVEAKAPKPAEAVSAAGAFRIFGKESQDTVQAVILFLLGVSYEAVALCLSWASKPIRKPEEEEKLEEAPVGPVQRVYTEDDYFKAMTSAGGGKLLGRDKVRELLPGLPEREARRLFEKLVDSGRIVGGKSPKLAQLSGEPQWELGIDK